MIVPLCTNPAQLNNVVKAPVLSGALAIARGSKTSNWKVSISLFSSDRVSNPLTFMSVAKTLAPSAAIARAAARPIPCPAAVIRTLLPRNLFIK